MMSTINLKSIYFESSEMSFTCFIIITLFDLLMEIVHIGEFERSPLKTENLDHIISAKKKVFI